MWVQAVVYGLWKAGFFIIREWESDRQINKLCSLIKILWNISKYFITESELSLKFCNLHMQTILLQKIICEALGVINLVYTQKGQILTPCTHAYFFSTPAPPFHPLFLSPSNYIEQSYTQTKLTTHASTVNTQHAQAHQIIFMLSLLY